MQISRTAFRREIGLLIAVSLAAVTIGAVIASMAAAGKPKTCICGPWKYTSTTGVAELSTSALTVKCARSTDLGEVTGGATGRDTVIFLECETAGKKCSSKGKPPGTIETEEDSTRLGFVNKARQEVGIDFKPPPGHEFLAQFECEGVAIKVEGSVLGSIGPINLMTTEGKEVFAESGGKQALERLEGGEVDVLKTITSLTGSTELESVLKAEGTTKNDEIVETVKHKLEHRDDPTEVRAEVSGKALEQPQYGRCVPHKKGHFEDSNCTKEALQERKGKRKYIGKFEFEPA